MKLLIAEATLELVNRGEKRLFLDELGVAMMTRAERHELEEALTEYGLTAEYDPLSRRWEISRGHEPARLRRV